ncbi:MAG: hypothetical protein KUG78_08395 [Kangiellaceae bacterium]|nr:hypothetical protein [Kangiellaceae bacterium]
MNKLSSKLVIGVVALVSVFCIGVSYGFKHGAENRANLESVVLGAVLTAQVNRLQSGTEDDVRNVEGLMNFYIDFGIDGFNWYQTDGNQFLSNMFLEEHVNLIEKSIITISKFRTENPDKSNPELVANLYEAEEKKLYLETLEARKQTIAIYEVKELTK